MGRTKGSKNTKKSLSTKLIESRKEVPLSEESRKKVEQGLKEAGEGKLECIDIEKQDKLKRVVNDLSKQFGKSVIRLAGQEAEKERLPFGLEQLDKLLGGGIPSGMFSILWGNKSSSKTTLTYLLIAQAQRKGKTCLFMDLEQSFDKEWARRMGVNVDTLLLGDFENAEQCLDTIIKLTGEKCIDLIVLDSIQSLSPKGEQETKAGKEKSVEDDTMALLARKLSQFFRMTAHRVFKGEVAMLLIGQARTDLGSFVKLDTLSGGHALGHWSAITMKVYRGSKADAPRYKFKVDGKSKELIIGFSLNLKIEKTKISGTAPESSVITLPFYFEYGFMKPTDKQIETTFKDWIEFESEE